MCCDRIINSFQLSGREDSTGFCQNTSPMGLKVYARPLLTQPAQTTVAMTLENRFSKLPYPKNYRRNAFER